MLMLETRQHIWILIVKEECIFAESLDIESNLFQVVLTPIDPCV